jgi:hypothetical protein
MMTPMVELIENINIYELRIAELVQLENYLELLGYLIRLLFAR